MKRLGGSSRQERKRRGSTGQFGGFLDGDSGNSCRHKRPVCKKSYLSDTPAISQEKDATRRGNHTKKYWSEMKGSSLVILLNLEDTCRSRAADLLASRSVGQEEDRRRSGGRQEEVWRTSGGGLEDVRRRTGGRQEDRRRSGGRQEEDRRRSGGRQEEVWRTSGGGQEDVRRRSGGRQEEDRRRSGGGLEEVRRRSGGGQEDVRRRSGGRQERSGGEVYLRRGLLKDFNLLNFWSYTS
ncbi:uncharacterized protein LOC122267640 [Penaeus japonicus]|uniref:uncharacterized protein LOC122267640 n=1 Tax=Penaeus japonicus TaxID=27405 RepID=UPI001C70EF25|nr:uncharacterized protein LOC122267640 [Penaeus japonicus]